MEKAEAGYLSRRVAQSPQARGPPAAAEGRGEEALRQLLGRGGVRTSEDSEKAAWADRTRGGQEGRERRRAHVRHGGVSGLGAA